MAARADGAAGRCTRLLQHCIDHGTSVAQCRVACEEWHHAPAWPSVAIERAFGIVINGIITMEPARMRHVPLHAQRLLRFASDLDGDMLTARDHVAVKTAMKKEA